MGKLHEVLAVEPDLEGTYRKMLEEAKGVFKKGEHYLGFTKTLTMFDDARKQEEEAGYEHRELTSTVQDKLDYVAESVVNYFDAFAQKEATNQLASADLVVDGKLLFAAAPATMLLGLETKLRQVREVYETIPTLHPGIKWTEDEQAGENIWVTAEPEVAMKTEKTLKPFVLYPATDKHPAQVKELQDTDNVGIYKKTIRSGMLSPKQKHELLARIDKLIRAVKVARQKANTQEVNTIQIGKTLMDFINKG
jgi:hypothetical protein